MAIIHASILVSDYLSIRLKIYYVMALGEKIVEESGKITGQRVLDVDPLKIESSFKMSGNYKGEEGSDIGTYWAVMRQGEEGVMIGEGQGVATTIGKKLERYEKLN
jgi:hypothetical protein